MAEDMGRGEEKKNRQTSGSSIHFSMFMKVQVHHDNPTHQSSKYLLLRGWRKVQGCNLLQLNPKWLTIILWHAVRQVLECYIQRVQLKVHFYSLLIYFFCSSWKWFVLAAHHVLLSIFDGDLKRGGKNGLTLMKMSTRYLYCCMYKILEFRASIAFMNLHSNTFSIITFFPSHSNINTINWLIVQIAFILISWNSSSLHFFFLYSIIHFH